MLSDFQPVSRNISENVQEREGHDYSGTIVGSPVYAFCVNDAIYTVTCMNRKSLRHTVSFSVTVIHRIHVFTIFKLSVYERQNVTFGRTLLPYKAQPANVRLPVLQVSGIIAEQRLRRV